MRRPSSRRWRDRLTAYRRQEDRDRFLLGCATVRRVVGALLGIAPGAVVLDRSCADCGRPHGKVRVVAPHPPELSVSHSGDVVLVAVHRGAPIGVDVERVDPDLDTASLSGFVLSPEEAEVVGSVPAADRTRAFTTYWTRKEAVLKATGDGLGGSCPAWWSRHPAVGLPSFAGGGFQRKDRSTCRTSRPLPVTSRRSPTSATGP